MIHTLTNLETFLTAFYERRLLERTQAGSFSIQHLNQSVRVRLGHGAKSAWVEIKHTEIKSQVTAQELVRLLDCKMELLVETYKKHVPLQTLS